MKVGHHDRAWDLALLVPQTGRWQEGLAASSREPVRQDAKILSFSLSKAKVAAVPIALRSHRALLGGDDKPIDNAIEIGSRISPLDLGTPLIDEEGRVVAILGRGCAPNDNRPCTPVAFGAPIAAIKGFLRTVPPTAVPARGLARHPGGRGEQRRRQGRARARGPPAEPGGGRQDPGQAIPPRATSSWRSTATP